MPLNGEAKIDVVPSEIQRRITKEAFYGLVTHSKP